MALRLDEDWKCIVKLAWSFRLIILAGILSGLELVLPVLIPGWPPGIAALASMGICVAAAVARIVAQQGVKG